MVSALPFSTRLPAGWLSCCRVAASPRNGFRVDPCQLSRVKSSGKQTMRWLRMSSSQAVAESRNAVHTSCGALTLCSGCGVSLQSSVSPTSLHSCQFVSVHSRSPVHRSVFTRLETRAKESNVCASAKVPNFSTKRKQTVNVSLRYSSQAAHDLL